MWSLPFPAWTNHTFSLLLLIPSRMASEITEHNGQKFFLKQIQALEFCKHSLPTKFHAEKLNELHGNLHNSNACYFGCWHLTFTPWCYLKVLQIKTLFNWIHFTSKLKPWVIRWLFTFSSHFGINSDSSLVVLANLAIRAETILSHTCYGINLYLHQTFTKTNYNLGLYFLSVQ